MLDRDGSHESALGALHDASVFSSALVCARTCANALICALAFMHACMHACHVRYHIAKPGNVPCCVVWRDVSERYASIRKGCYC